MNIRSLNRLTVSRKILFVFVLAAFVPIVFLTYFSSNYVSNILQKETQQNLLHHAKSYGLFTLEKLKSVDKRLDEISIKTNNTLPENIISEFENVKLKRIDNPHHARSLENEKTRLDHHYDKYKQTTFTLEKLHKDTLGNSYTLHASFTIDSIFNAGNDSPFNEPACIFTETGKILFCNKNVELKEAELRNASTLINTEQRILEHEFSGHTYTLAAWELFLPSKFQSESWYFVILKEQSVLLHTINNFRDFIIPFSLLFILLITYSINIFIGRLMSPLAKLTLATKDITQGKYDINLDIKTNDEFHSLSKSFNMMSSSLHQQHIKDAVLSNMEHTMLMRADIHLMLSENIHDLGKLFNADWMIISLIDPLNPSDMMSHSSTRTAGGLNNRYARIKHDTFRMHDIKNDYQLIDNDEFQRNYQPMSSGFHANHISLKLLTLNEETIGCAFIASSKSMQNPNINTALLTEFAERFSTIYTTHKQSADLYYKANFDALTNLPNRRYLLETLKKKWTPCVENNSTLAIFFIDLDNFKNVNDLSGHKAGNDVLIQVAERISHCIDEHGVLARLSGDEFCILYEIKDANEEISFIANKIITQIQRPFIIKDMSHFLGASIGIATGPDHCESPSLLIERADLAMYKAKQDGKNRVVVFDDGIEQDRNYRLSLEHYLHFALKNNEISLNYQPKIDLSTGNLLSVECLARWNQSEIGFVSTDSFITLAEESGMINEIGTWILRKSCYQFVDWTAKGILLESIAVNVSTRQLASRDFSHIVASVIQETGIPPQCLDLEITESAFINDESLLKSELNKLHSLGVKISIDDFGKEYSSLSYLKKIPFDTLKIDREFIIDLETDQRDQHIIDVIINIGHTLGKKIVAEGIETIKQRDILRMYGCDIGQGYLFSKPLTDIELLAFAAEYRNSGMSTEVLTLLSSEASHA